MNNYLVATIKRWNVKKFWEKDLGGHWYLVDGREELTIETCKQINPRYIFFAHWSWMIPPEIYENYECVVFHPADLPDGRGSSLFQHRIKSGVYHTKVSALKVTKGIDTGDIYIKRDFCMNGGGEEIYLRLADLIFDEMIPEIVRNEPIPVPQVGKGTIFRRRTPEDSEIETDNLNKLYDFIRMLDADTYPPAYIDYGNLRIEFTRASLKHDCILTDVKIREQ